MAFKKLGKRVVNVGSMAHQTALLRKKISKKPKADREMRKVKIIPVTSQEVLWILGSQNIEEIENILARVNTAPTKLMWRETSRNKFKGGELIMGRKKTRSIIDCESVSQILRDLTYSEAFFFFTGVGKYISLFASSLNDFLEKLEKAPLKSVEFHFKRGDFENWISKTLGDEKLANEIRKIGKSIRGEDLRKMIRRMVKRRLSLLEKLLKKS